METTKERREVEGGAAEEFWGLKTVIARTGLSRSTLYAYVAQGLVPRQRRLGPRRVAWFASEVRAWMASRPCQTGPCSGPLERAR